MYFSLWLLIFFMVVFLGRLWRNDLDGSLWFRGRWYIIPEETSIGRQPHNLRRELFRSNEVDENEVC